MYFRIELFGNSEVDASGSRVNKFGEGTYYSIRLNNNANPNVANSGIMLRNQYSSNIPSSWSSDPSYAKIFVDTNGDVSGANGVNYTKDDGDQIGSNDGYDLDRSNSNYLYVRQTTVSYSGPGGTVNRPAVEFAFKYTAYNQNFSTNFSPSTITYLEFDATRGLKDNQNYLWNDEYTLNEAGSPNPAPTGPNSGNLGEAGTSGTQNVYQLDTIRGWGGFFVAEPGIYIKKYTNGEDADAAPGPVLLPGAAITWRYVVTNTGNVALGTISVVDDQAGVTPQYLSGDVDSDGSLDLNETWIYEAYGTAVAGQYQNVGTVTGQYNGTSVQDDDPSHYYCELPKATIGDYVWNDLNRNGIQEAGEPGLENVAVELHKSDGSLSGSMVTNSDGQYLFSNVESGDYYVVFVLPTGYAFTLQDQGVDEGRDSDANMATGRTATTTLAPGEEDRTWDAGLYKLVAAIHIEKLTNGDDADLPTGPSIPVGGTVTWTYEVTNPGDVALSNVVVSDNQAGVSPVYVSGDNGNGLLNPGEKWIYQASGTAISGQYQNIGTVSGQYNGQTVTDEDPSHYFGGQAAIQIKKYTNGEDADVPPGPYITPGGMVTWTYVISNTGNVAISNIVVTDSEAGVTPVYVSGDNGNGLLDVGESWNWQATGTAEVGQYANIGTVNGQDAYGQPVSDSDPSHYFGPEPQINIEKLVNGEDADVPTGPAIAVGQAVQWSYIVTNVGNVPLSDIVVSDDKGVTPQGVDTTPPDGFNDGDLDKDNLLDVGETWTYTASGVAAAGQYVNNGTVTGKFAGQTVTDTDPAHYYGGQPAIQIKKYTNGEDADNPTGPGVIVGSVVTWRYEIRNLGNTPIRDVAVSDNQGVTVAAVDAAPADGFNDGDLDKDNLLDVNETWIYQATGSAEPGQYANIGTVTGTDILTNQPVSDEDPSHYFGASPGIYIKKYTNGEDADAAPGPVLLPGAAITWRYVVTNTGNVALGTISVVDDQAGVTPQYLSGDVDSDGSLDLNETWIYEAYGTAVAGQYQNVGTVTGQYNGTSVQDDDPSHYFSESDLDFGDVPDPGYPTLLASNGARHVLSQLFMGSKIDAEPDGLASPNASGDDADGLDDEDGVNFPNLPLLQGKANIVNVVSSGSGYLNAWIDFNKDGDFNDNGEHIITNYAVIAGTNSISFMVPMIAPGAPPQLLNLNSRFRLASQRGLGVTGLALDGEVEDHQVTTYVPVELSSFSAQVDNGHVQLSWTTQSESENLGFLIFRSETEEGQYEQITARVIPGAGSSSQEHAYSFVDAQVSDGKEYYYKLADVQFDGTVRYHQILKVTVTAPVEYALDQNYPNPFNPTTTISFRVKEAGQVELAIFNVKGELIRNLVSENKNAGFYAVEWDARDDSGAAVPSGTYLYLLSVNGFRMSKQMTLLK